MLLLDLGILCKNFESNMHINMHKTQLKYAKNVLKYALNMQKNIFNKMSLFLLILRVLVNFTKQFFTFHSTSKM